MEFKKCRLCNEEKEINQFRKSGKYIRKECKTCENKATIERNKKNKKHILEMQKKWRDNNPEKLQKYREKDYDKIKRKEYNKKYYEENKEYYKKHHKDYFNKNKDKIKENYKKWKNNNIEKVREYQRKDALKRKQDPLKKLELQLRNMINTSFKRKGQVKSKKLELICGLNSKELVNYLLNTFKENYGYEWNNTEKVHIDHIIPLKTAKTIEDVYRLCYYSNLQLLKPKDNFEKGAKEDWVLQSQ